MERLGLKCQIATVLSGTLLIALTGCAPPPPHAPNTGHQIIKVSPETKPPAQTVEMNGIEYRQSRFPVGKPGGAFYDTLMGSGPKTFNPMASFDATSSAMAGQMFAGLFETDAYTGETVPYLAKSLEVKPDNLTYIVKLRKGLVWSDGHPITADDVVYTWNDVIKAGLGNPSNRDVIMIDGKLPDVWKIDDLTIGFKTPAPFAPFKSNLGNQIIPKHIVEPVIKKDPKDFDSLWGVGDDPKTFVGSGPFLLEQYVSGQRVVFKKNPHFFMIDSQGQHLPYLSHYIYEIVQDQNAEMLQFEQGRVDSVAVPGKSVYYIKQLKTPKFRMYDLGPTSGTTYITFNMNPRKNKSTGKPYVNPVRLKWFRDLNFRKAVDYAIHRDQIINNTLMGIGAPLFTAEGLPSVYLNQKIANGHPADLEKAKAYLKASGFKWNSAGELFDKDGNRVMFDLLTNAGNQEREATCISIKEDLQALGIKVNYKPIDFNVLVGKISGGGTLEWEAIVMGLTGSPIEPHGGINVWNSKGALHLFNQRNPQQDAPGNDALEPWEVTIDKLYNQGATTIETDKRKAIYNDVQQVIYDNLPMIYLYSPRQVIAVKDRLQNVDPTPLGTFHNLESIWIK